MKDLYIDCFKDGITGILIGTFFWGVSLFLAGLLFYGIFVLADSVGVDSKSGTAVVEARYHTDAYTTTSIISNGKTMIPTTTHHPESWSLGVSILGDQSTVNVNQSLFKVVRVGSELEAEYVVGRMSGDIYINRLKLN